GRLWSGLTNFHSWFVPVKLEVGIVDNLVNCIFITFIAYEENIQVIYSEILLKSMFIYIR
ncbi:hypothetical protein ACTHTV_01100, partial [Neisseria sp. P0015.S010]